MFVTGSNELQTKPTTANEAPAPVGLENNHETDSSQKIDSLSTKTSVRPKSTISTAKFERQPKLKAFYRHKKSSSFFRGVSSAATALAGFKYEPDASPTVRINPLILKALNK